MMGESNYKNLSDEIKVARESQINFAYYLIGLAVAAIAYGIEQTNDKPLSWSQIPLGLSVLLFFICIVLGLSYIRTLNASMHMDILFFKKENSIEDDHELSSDQKFDLRLEVYNERLRSEAKLTRRNSVTFKIQRISFLAAIVLFVVWRIYEMYLLTNSL